MNRQIKFRAWDKENKEMGRVTVVDFNNLLIRPNEARIAIRTKSHPYNGIWREYKNLELMQFTGLLDKHGKEIYEGDILRWDQWEQEGTEKPDYYVVKYYNASFVTDCFRDEKIIEHQDIMEEPMDFEIVGNIYENPELVDYE